MTPDLDALDELAREAGETGPGWLQAEFLLAFIDNDDEAVVERADAMLVAALDPATVRALIALARLGAAWEEAEAALPEGFRLEVHGPIDLSVAARLPQPGVWRARSVAPFMPYEEWQKSVRSEYAATPAAALLALAAALRTPEPVKP